MYLSQYDTDYDIEFTVLDKYAKATGIDGYTAKFTGTRCDGLGFTFESTASDETVTFEINTSLTAISGTHKGEIVFYDTNGLFFGSANVQIVVEPAARKDGTIDADVERAQEIADQIQEIVDTAAEETTAEARQIVADLEEDVADIKEDLSDMNTATSADVGKALKAKTVTDGKVTEWEFGDAGTSVELDATLTDATKAAQAKAVGDELFIDTSSETPATASATASDWRLKADGYAEPNQSYNLKKYQVTAGNTIKVVSDDFFQFQTSASVSTSGTQKIVGETYTTGTFTLDVPATATYLIVSTPKTNSQAAVYNVVAGERFSKIGALTDRLDAIDTASAADVGKVPKVKTVTDGQVTEWEFGSTGGDLSGLILELDKSDKSAVYSKGNVGSSISFSSSTTSYTFKKIIPVEQGKTYTLKITNGTTPAGTSARDSRITDNNGIVKQLIPIETVADETFIAVFTALADGWFYLTLDNQYTALSLEGGQIYEDHNDLQTVSEEVDVINDVVGIEKAEYYGLYTQSSSDGYLINTPVPDTTYDARILMRLLNVKAGDEVTLSLSDYWTDTSYNFCVQTCKADNKALTTYGTRAYVNTSDVSVSEKLNNNFISVKKAVPVVINFTNDYPVVYVTIRWPKDRTTNGNYDKVANVTVRRSATVKQAVTLLDIRKRVGDISSIHRGWADAKDNSLQAFYNSFVKGYRFCECDIRWTSDNVPVLSHDSTVSGYVNGVATSYTIEDVTLETLKGLVITNGKYDNMAVPTVEEAIQLGKFMGGRYVLDNIKTMSTARYDIILGLLEQYDYWDGLLFNTNAELAQYVLDESDGRACLYIETSTLAEIEQSITDPNKVYIIYDMNNLPTQTVVNAISAKGYNIGAWNVSGDNFFTALDYNFDLLEYTDGSKSYYDWYTLGEQWYNSRLADFATNHNITR